MQGFLRFLRRAYVHRGMIWAMARRDLRERHIGTVGGVLWSFLQPLLLVATYWFVFSQGFKVSLVSDVPFILYFVVGLAPWLLFAEALGTSVGSVVANGHLIRKLVFPSEILPVVHIVTAAVVHAAMLAIVAAAVFLHGYVPTWHLLQLPYYTLAALTLALGLGWVLAAVNVFYRDVGQITQASLNILFWLTPVVWPLDLLPAAARPYLMLNPMYYVVEGYRDCLLTGVPLWERGWQALAFWSVSLPLLAVGAILFRRLKPDFAEVV